jgi:hypothetical protein
LKSQIRNSGEEVSSEEISWKVQEITDLVSTEKWETDFETEGGLNCPRIK